MKALVLHHDDGSTFVSFVDADRAKVFVLRIHINLVRARLPQSAPEDLQRDGPKRST